MKFNCLRWILLPVIIMALPIFSFGSDRPQALFEKGNALYAKSQYKEALAAYRQVLDEGYESAALYYNMGNASLKSDDIPSAILYYEKAHKLNPGDDDINYNLRFANSKTTDKIDEVPEFFLARWWRLFILSFSTGTLAALSIIAVLLGSVMLVLYFFAGSVAVKKGAFYVSMVLFVAGVLTTFMAAMQTSYFAGHKQAIVFSGAATVKSAPLEKAATLFVIHDGTRVNILDNNDGWTKIRLANGNEGWIKDDDVKEI